MLNQIALSLSCPDPMECRLEEVSCIQVLSIAHKQENRVLRLFALLQASKALVKLAFHQKACGDQKNASPIFGLFGLHWFVALWN